MRRFESSAQIERYKLTCQILTLDAAIDFDQSMVIGERLEQKWIKSIAPLKHYPASVQCGRLIDAVY